VVTVLWQLKPCQQSKFVSTNELTDSATVFDLVHMLAHIDEIAFFHATFSGAINPNITAFLRTSFGRKLRLHAKFLQMVPVISHTETLRWPSAEMLRGVFELVMCDTLKEYVNPYRVGIYPQLLSELWAACKGGINCRRLLIQMLSWALPTTDSATIIDWTVNVSFT